LTISQAWPLILRETIGRAEALGMKWNWAPLGVAVALASSPALAQQVVGTSIVEGRAIQIMSDNTWRYSTPAPANCETVQEGVVFCGKARGWVRTRGNSNDAGPVYRRNDRAYGLLLIEKVGADEGMSADTMRKAVLGNAAGAAGLQEKDVTAFGVERSRTVSGFAAETISYAVKMGGIPFVFTNTIIIDKHRTVQVATYGVGQALTEEMKADHKSFVEATQLK
jgi:hypothetical protein